MFSAQQAVVAVVMQPENVYPQPLLVAHVASVFSPPDQIGLSAQSVPSVLSVPEQVASAGQVTVAVAHESATWLLSMPLTGGSREQVAVAAANEQPFAVAQVLAD
jgi:hypothetical protein